MNAISAAFLKAYEHSWTFMHDSEEDSYGFGTADVQPPLPALPDSRSPESHPAHLDSVTLVLSPERYQRLARALSALLEAAYAEGHSPHGQPCTLAVLGFHAADASPRSLSHTVNSFLGAQ